MRFTLCLALTLALTACGTDGNPPRQVDAAVLALDALPDVAPAVDATSRDVFDAADIALVTPDVASLDATADVPGDAVDATPADDRVDASAADTGCDAATETDPTNCGACGAVCPTRANASPVCAAGMCDSLGACRPGFGDCNRRALDGCESDLSTDVMNCGACGRPCAFRNGNARCVAGVCELVSCIAANLDCDREPSNGCEVDRNTSTLHCGGCGRPCNVPNAAPLCTNGTCGINSCVAGFINCDGNAANGCEINIRTDPMNCGNCGTRCPTGQMCVSGNCFLICPDGQRPCGARCVDTDAGC